MTRNGNAEPTGREVACRAFGRLLDEWERAGLEPADLVAGSGCSVEQLYDQHERISWSSYRAIMTNARQRWDDEGLVALGLVILDTPWARPVTIPARLLSTPRDVYRWMARPRTGVSQRMFTCIDHALREMEPGRLIMECTMHEGYPPCREYLLITQGALAAIPTLLGLPLARVRLEETAGGGRYDIRYPLGGGALAWLRRAVTWPFTARAAARELEDAQVELHQRNRELEAKNRELELRNAELERYAYTVSHDLKSPLVTIKGFLGLLEKDALAGDEERLRDDLARIHHAADRMRELMTDLLELSRVGHLSPSREEIALSRLAREAMGLLAGAIAERDARIEIQPDMPVLTGDRLRLLEVYQNLIENALRFMGEQPHPRVRIGARQSEHETICYVADNGIGIEPRYHEQVFGLFNRLGPAGEGTGIGLALVKRIVEAHGGRAWVESAGGGQGTTVLFALPRLAAGGDSAQRAERSPASTRAASSSSSPPSTR